MAAGSKAPATEPDAEAPATGAKTYTVTAPLVTARTENDRMVYLHQGDVVPAGLSQGSIDHLLNLGYISDAT